MGKVKMIALRYVGKDGAYVMGIPKRDLSEKEVECFAEAGHYSIKLFTALLVAGGCYEAPPKPKIRKPKEEDK